MDANEVIDCYVADVARRIPRRQRNDVAFELRALLAEGLDERSQDEGRPADADMAVDFLRRFGDPARIAAGYRPSLTIIDPADGHRFLWASGVGLVLIWTLGLVSQWQQPLPAGAHWLSALGAWWMGTVIPSLWWPGVLVLGFGLAAWSRARPSASAWTPRSVDHLEGGRVGAFWGLAGMIAGLLVLLDPAAALAWISDGRAAPQAYTALTYTEGFRQLRGPILFGLVALNVPLLLAVLAHGRWSERLRRLHLALAVATCAAIAWVALDGPVFAVAASNQMTKLSLWLVLGFSLLGLLMQWRRRLRPAPG